MTDSYNSKQLEMFKNYLQHDEQTEDTQRSLAITKEINKRWLIIGIIVLIVLNLFSYSLGIEIGVRKAKQAYSQNKIQGIENNFNSKNTNLIKTTDIKKEESGDTAIKTQGRKEIQVEGNYSIQIASYASEEKAKKQIDSLKKKGYTDVFIADKGKYIIVCVGNFKTQKEASILLKELKKIYRDAYIRRI